MARQFGFALTLVANSLLIVSLSFADTETTPAPLSAGKKLFNQYCSSCHGISGAGDGPVADSLGLKIPDLRMIASRRRGEFNRAELMAIVDGRTAVGAHGTKEMPVWGRKFSEEFGSDQVAEEAAQGYVSAIVDYLKSIQNK